MCAKCQNDNNKRRPLSVLLLFAAAAAAICCCCDAVAGAQQQPLIPHGSSQLYELQNKVIMQTLQDGADSQQTHYILRSQLIINSVWHSAKEQLLQLYFTQNSISAPSQKSDKLLEQRLDSIPDRPFYISLLQQQPDKVVAHTSRDQSLLNLERGIASLLQLRLEDGAHNEIDVAGNCVAFYKLLSSTRVEKTKTDCSHWDLRLSYRAEKPLSVQQSSWQRLEYILTTEGALQQVESLERHRIQLAAKTDAGNQIEATFTLKHLEVLQEQVEQMPYTTLQDAIDSTLEWYRIFDIQADVDGAISELKQSNLKQQLQSYKNQLKAENVGKTELALAIAELLPWARIASYEELLQILKSNKELHAQLVDLLGAAQTVHAHNAIFHTFDQHELLEKYLQSLAVSTQPNRQIIEDLFERLQQLPLLEHEKLYESLLHTTVALCKHADDALQQQLVEFISKQLNEVCTSADCQLLYLRALQNLQASSTLPTLLQLALEADNKISVAAMQALRNFPINLFTDAHRKALSSLFYQRKRKYDSTARIYALDILLALKPNQQQLLELLNYLASNDAQFELKTYVLQKLRLLQEKCARFAVMLRSVLAQSPHVNNYNVIAQKGLTTVLTRQLSQAPAFNETLLSVQEIYQGVLKRGSVEILLGAGKEEFSTFKLGIFTSGLSSFVGDADADAADDEDEPDNSPATAGMEIYVQGVLLRPLVFFTGQTELMGHVWSGTASDATPAYQATVLAEDHEHYIILASGATLYTRVIGTRSVDLNGKVALSIWNRNANTEIKQNSALAVVGYSVVGCSYAQVANQFTLTAQPNLSLQADIDFYSGIKLCMQLQRTEMLLRHTNDKTLTLRAGKKTYKKSVRTNLLHKFPGRTLALNQKNNEMCNQIFA